MDGETCNFLKKFIRDIPDFPKKGIVFKDITPMLADPAAFTRAMNQFEGICGRLRTDESGAVSIASIESRGFILGGALASKTSAGMIPIRKEGKLPYKTAKEKYALEYGEGVLEIHEDALRHARRGISLNKVLIVDDVLATGGTALAAARLVEKIGGEVAGIAVMIELESLGGRAKLEKAGYKVESVLKYD